jgi:hypothetical protein
VPTYPQSFHRKPLTYAQDRLLIFLMGDTLTILALVAAGVSCVAAAISSYFARKNNVGALRADVAEMLDAVDKIARDTRSAKMQRVRQAREDLAAAPPPQYKGPLETEADPKALKTALRQKLVGIRH